MWTQVFEQLHKRQAEDAARYTDHDQNRCMLCNTTGPDKRSLFISCFYDVKEIVFEFLDLKNVPDHSRDSYLRICKHCRSTFLDHLRQWAIECREARGMSMDGDGNLEEHVSEPSIPIRHNGRIVMLTSMEYALYIAEGHLPPGK